MITRGTGADLRAATSRARATRKRAIHIGILSGVLNERSVALQAEKSEHAPLQRTAQFKCLSPVVKHTQILYDTDANGLVS